MKKIKAQLSSDILKELVPMGAIDWTRDFLTPKESQALNILWKDGKRVGDKIMLPNGYDRLVFSSLINKNYLKWDGYTVEITSKGKIEIKNALMKEENAFSKKAKNA